jgi:glycosyltransferase involved in cell wall biosynthesis
MMISHRLTKYVAAVSAGAACDVAKLATLGCDRVQVLYNPIPKRLQPSSQSINLAEKMWGCPPGQRILTVASLKKEKNQALLLHAFLTFTKPEARLMLVGKGPIEPELRALSHSLGISDRVIFAGFQSDTAPFYATADLFVLSSDQEGFGNVLVEALSFGLPLVSTDCPSGPAEILENGRWGCLVPMGDSVALAQAMNKTISSKLESDDLKQRANEFLPEMVADNYLKLLNIQ